MTPPLRLTELQLYVLQCLARGDTIKGISLGTGRSESSLQQVVCAAWHANNCRSRAQLFTRFGVRNGSKIVTKRNCPSFRLETA